MKKLLLPVCALVLLVSCGKHHPKTYQCHCSGRDSSIAGHYEAEGYTGISEGEAGNRCNTFKANWEKKWGDSVNHNLECDMEQFLYE